MANKQFKTTLDRFEKPHLWDYHLKVPTAIANSFYEDKARRVLCSINGKDPFQTGIMPDGDDVFFIKINQQIRRQHNLETGDLVSVTLISDQSEYGFNLPSEFEELMAQDQEGSTYFEALTPGKKRSLIYMIDKLKNMEKRVQKSIIIFEHLKQQKGKLDFKLLHQAFRNA